MNLPDAVNTFALRLYDWAHDDLIRELNTDCPLLSLVGLNYRYTAGFVAWNKSLNADDRQAVARALLLRSHANAARLRGESLSELDKRWLTRIYEGASFEMARLPPLHSANRTLPGFKAVNPDRCLDRLITLIPSALGKPSRRKSGIVCTRRLGDWKIITEFTFDRRDDLLLFEYQFVRRDGEPHRSLGPGPFPRSLFLFWGLSDTVVFVASESDVEPMTQIMTQLAAYFVSQANPLFEGLGISD